MLQYALDDKIINWTSSSKPWTFRHAFEGVQIFGSIGSGKSSGSGQKIALKYLENGFGGLVLTVKHDEVEVWKDYANRTNRLQDLIIIEPDGKYNFNFLEYESSLTETNKSITDNIVEVLKTVIRAGQEKDAGKSEDSFWENALDMLIYNVIDLCKMAYGKISVDLLHEIAQNLPRVDDDDKKSSSKNTAFEKAYRAAHADVMAKVRTWYKNLDLKTVDIDELSEIEIEALYLKAIPEARLFKHLHQYFFEALKNLNEKTRSIIDFTFTGFLFRLLKQPIYSIFCDGTSNVTPEDCFKGKIIIINFPVKIYHKVGRDCQILFKYIWQRRMEKRNIKLNNTPVFLFADEAQNFIHEHDADFQATARSSRVATVYLTQNIPNYYGSMGGKTGEYKIKSFVGTLGTKIFHANSDIETNNYSSELIGKAEFIKTNRGINSNKDSQGFSRSESVSWEPVYQPHDFVGLRNGGATNNNIVDAIIQIQGTPILSYPDNPKDFENYSLVSIKQLDN